MDSLSDSLACALIYIGTQTITSNKYFHEKQPDFLLKIPCK